MTTTKQYQQIFICTNQILYHHLVGDCTRGLWVEQTAALQRELAGRLAFHFAGSKACGTYDTRRYRGIDSISETYEKRLHRIQKCRKHNNFRIRQHLGTIVDAAPSPGMNIRYTPSCRILLKSTANTSSPLK